MLISKQTKITQRSRAIELYYKNPKICNYCNSIIHIPDNIKPSQIKVKKFCNLSCSASFNNNRKGTSDKLNKTKICKNCSLEFIPETVYKVLCPNCRTSKLPNTTKIELFTKCKNYQSARSIITHNALRIYNESGQPRLCFICGYSTFTDTCHIRDVKDFSNNALIKDINKLDNLVALCPNHHKEFDNNLFSLFK